MSGNRCSAWGSERRPFANGWARAGFSPPLRSGLGKRVRGTGRAVGARRRGGFTLVELLVVIAVIALLLTVLLVAGNSVFEDARIKETKTVLFALDQAVTQFHSAAPLRRVSDYRDRYGDYPCDELEAFDSDTGIPNATTPTIGPGTVSDLMVPGAGLMDVKHRDVKAMALVMRLYSDEAAAILDTISAKYRRTPADPKSQFFDRDGDGALDPDDETLVYYVDAWGTPIEYFALNPPRTPPPTAAGTDPMGARLNASAAFVGLNHGRPLLVSYGPDGADQLAAFGQGSAESESPLVEDYRDGGVIDDPLNEDNVYLDDTIKTRLRPGGAG